MAAAQRLIKRLNEEKKALEGDNDFKQGSLEKLNDELALNQQVTLCRPLACVRLTLSLQSLSMIKTQLTEEKRKLAEYQSSQDDNADRLLEAQQDLEEEMMAIGKAIAEASLETLAWFAYSRQ